MDRRINWFLNEQHLEQYSDKFIHFNFVTFLTLRHNAISEIIPSISDSTKLYRAIKSFINEPDSEDETIASSVNEFVLPDIIDYIPFEKREVDESFQSPSLIISNVQSLPTSFEIKEEEKEEEDIDLLYETRIVDDNVQTSTKFVHFIPPAKRKLDESFQPRSVTIAKIARPENNETIPTIEIKDEAEEDINIGEIIKSRPVTIKKITSTTLKEVEENVKINGNTQAPSESQNGYVDNVQTSIKSINMKSVRRLKTQKYLLKKLVTTLDFEQILDLDMRILVSIYKHKTDFTNSERMSLSEVLIKQILIIDSTFVLKETDFFNLAKLIVSKFRYETISFYFKAVEDFNLESYIADRGSLYTAYRKYKELISRSGLVISNQRSIDSTFNKGSFEKLKIKFIESRSERLKTYNEDPDVFSINTYMQTHEVLQDYRGYRLIINDAEYLYPRLRGITNRFSDKAITIIEYAKKLQIDDEYVTNLLSYSNDLLPRKRRLLAILLLPYVMPQATLKRDEDDPITVSHLASSVQFVRLFKDKAEEIRIYKQLVREDPKFKTGLINVNLKLYGEFDNVNECEVKVSSTVYEFCDPLKAIEVYFKMFLGLNVDYPCYARHIFCCFEKIAFSIKTKSRTKDELSQIAPFLKLIYSKDNL